MSDPKDDQKSGKADGISTAYVLGGVPFLILFFLGLFGLLVGSCDSANILVPF